jgi:hypothetical protein
MRAKPRKHLLMNLLRKACPEVLLRAVARIRSKFKNRGFVNASPEEIFSQIYKKNSWGGDSVSGMGSDLQQTESLRSHLPRLLGKYSVKSILDVPCGDFSWMQSVNLDGIQYIGGDIVTDLIINNQKHFGSSSRIFAALNLIKDDLPQADLLLCRDCLIHLSLHDIKLVLQNILNSSTPYLLTTTYPLLLKNSDIITGDFRALNLTLPPFSFPSPLETIQEDLFPEHPDNPNFIRELGLWRVSDLRHLIRSPI